MTDKLSALTFAHCSTALLSFALLLLLPLPAVAWNSAGHRLVAHIAWDNLNPAARAEAGRLLRAHPDFDRWLKRAGEDEARDPERAAFIEASIWPDDIRNDPRFYSAGLDAATPALPGFPDMERRRDWHYINRPLNPPTSVQAAPISGQIDKQLVSLAAQLADPRADIAAKAYALPWLIHLVGDAHQPLHTSARLDAAGKWDKLGNAVLIDNPFDARKPQITLHAFWDSLPGPSWLRGERLNTACRALSAVYPRPAPSEPDEWINESWQLAGSSAYPPGKGSELTISPEFFENAREIANRRVAQAGYRLADLLRDLFNSKTPQKR